jgi:hypothetical protein
MFVRSAPSGTISEGSSFGFSDFTDAALEIEQACLEMDGMLADVDVLCGVIQSASTYGTSPAVLPLIERDMERLQLSTAIGACMEALGNDHPMITGALTAVKEKLAGWASAAMHAFSSAGKYISAACSRMADLVSSAVTRMKNLIARGAEISEETGIAHSVKKILIMKGALLALVTTVGFIWGRGIPASGVQARDVMAKATALTSVSMKGAATVALKDNRMTITAIKEATKPAVEYGWTKQSIVQVFMGLGASLRKLPSSLTSKFATVMQLIRKTDVTRVVANATGGAAMEGIGVTIARSIASGGRGLIGFTLRMLFSGLRVMWRITNSAMRGVLDMLGGATKSAVTAAASVTAVTALADTKAAHEEGATGKDTRITSPKAAAAALLNATKVGIEKLLADPSLAVRS